MMEIDFGPLATLQMDFKINAQRFISEVHTNNKELEEVAQRAIEAAFNEFCKDENLFDHIKKSALRSIENTVSQILLSYETKSAISKAIEAAIGKKIEEYGNKVAEKMMSGIEGL